MFGLINENTAIQDDVLIPDITASSKQDILLKMQTPQN